MNAHKVLTYTEKVNSQKETPKLLPGETNGLTGSKPAKEVESIITLQTESPRGR